MAIAVWTNSNVSPSKSVSLTTLSVSGYSTADFVESTTVTKTPFTANSVSASSPYNVYNIAPVTNPTQLVTPYNYSDLLESLTITRTPLVLNVPNATGFNANGVVYSGSYTLNRIYTREIWITG